MPNQFEPGDTVVIDSPGHRQHGQTGTVAYIGSFWGTIGVTINGHDYGFFPSELSPVTREPKGTP